MKSVFLLFSLLPMIISAQQNVGIGTPSPTSKLHITTNSTLSSAHLRLTESGTDFARLKMENTVHTGAYWDIAGLADTMGGNAKLNFFFANPSMSGDRLTILGDGHVGIGNTSPDAKLDITGGDWNLENGNPGDLRIGNAGSNLRIGVVTSGINTGNARMFSSNSLFLGTNNTVHFSINPIGNIGIGTGNTSNRLRVLGQTTSSASVVRVSNSYTGAADVIGVESTSSPMTGYGIGGYFLGGYRGLHSIGDGTTYTGQVIALEASATGTAGTRIGILGKATGGTINWAGYFDPGNVYIAHELRIGAAAFTGVSGYKVVVDGKILAEELRIKLSQNWPDYVFGEEYELMPLDKLEACIKKTNHLPGIPTAAEVAANGIELGDMQIKSMEKIEELTLYIIQQDKRIHELMQRITILEQQ